MPILHETTWDNYFIVKCLLKSNVLRVILLTNCIEYPEYNLKLTKLKQKLQLIISPGYIKRFDSFIFPHFNLNILYSVHLSDIRWSLVINLFSVFCSKDWIICGEMYLHYAVDFTVITYYTSNLDTAKL